MYRKIVLLLLPIASIAISGIQSDIRCHCNQPVCVRTGYMCKSKGPQAGCFVEHSGHVNMDRSSDISRHGCIEMLPIDERLSCLELALAINTHHNHNHHGTLMHNHRHVQNKQNRPSQSFRTNNKTITCCLDDMCNYVKTIVADDLPNSSDNNNDDDGNFDGPLEHRKQNQRTNHHQQSRNHDFNSHYRTTQSLSNNDQFDSLGRQLQESYGIDDSLQQEVPLGFIISFIVILFIILVALIFCVICYIRNDVNKNQQLQHHQQQHPQRFCKSDGNLLPPYSSKPNTNNFNNNNILCWRNFMNPKKNSSYPGRILAGKNGSKLFKTSQQQQQQQQQHPSLLLIVNNCQMDNPMMTKLDDDEQDAFEIPSRCLQPSSKPNNLPNIISVHSLPNPDNDFKIEFNDAATINNKETTFDVGSLSSSATRMEKQNSIYMSPGQIFNTDSLIQQHHSTTAHGIRSDFDLISNTSNPNPIV